MSNSEKIVYDPEQGQQQHTQQQGGLLPQAPMQGEFPPPPTQPHTSSEKQDFPPPPPGPPPHQEYQHQEQQQFAPPPAYQQGEFSGSTSEKPQVPPPAQSQPGELFAAASGSEKQQQAPPHQGDFSTSTSETHFPPPPPGPPPSQGYHPDPLHAHPVAHGEQSTEQQQAYTIPQYNPAAPVFAPPPINDQADSAPPLATVHETETAPAPAPVPAAVPGSVPAAAATTSTEEPHKKHGWSERFSNLGIKAAAPINSLAHKLGSQSFLPETLDKECDKAASILRTFCSKSPITHPLSQLWRLHICDGNSHVTEKGVYADPGSGQPPTSTDPKATATNDTIIDPTKNKPKSRVIVTIPPKVISKAVGLAIFTTLRAGFNVSGATGSGILIARLPDGSWGPPSGIQIHSVGGGFSMGLDIYDCVCVINSREALTAFTNTRVGLGTDLAVVAGPYGAGGAVEFGTAMENREGRKPTKDGAVPDTPADKQTLKPETNKNSKRRSLSASSFKPVFSYVKSRGFYAGIQIDGTVVVERKDANAGFYGERVSVEKILKGQVPAQGPSGMWPAGARVLLETLKGAEAGVLAVKDKDGKVSGAPAHVPAAAGQSSTAAGSGTEQLPPYVDDGIARPAVGDYKYQ
ncbi:hypothetical protein AK830_g3096 [Neonectria ditissima]|uniref:Ysc84 actin-binding domain-containing protein n=1 Tax=Neonectria ditissima TaxID=78410 RepID=A0A0N8H834_9HYPO|nr:hypothetical protein AK830_g3096 [Neonectria ditissima]